MRAVTVAAAHLSEAHWVGRWFLKLALLLQMAGEAHVGLAALHEHRVTILVHPVAICAGDTAAFMHACVPADPRAGLVAAEAWQVAFLRRLRRAGFEAIDRLGVLAARVPGTGAVASLALQTARAEGRALVAAKGMLALEDRRARVARRDVVVALEAGVSTLLAQPDRAAVGAPLRLVPRCRPAAGALAAAEALAAAGLAAAALAGAAGWAHAPAHASRPASASSTRGRRPNVAIYCPPFDTVLGIATTRFLTDRNGPTGNTFFVTRSVFVRMAGSQ